jgi:hypothetical protein
MDLAAAAAGARATAGAAGGRGSERLRATRTERPRYYRERADASVRCTGLGADMCQSQGHVPGTSVALSESNRCFFLLGGRPCISMGVTNEEHQISFTITILWECR